MPILQYPNPNKLLMLFMDTSKSTFMSILYQEKTPHHLGAEVNLISIAYFLGSFGRTQQLWNTTQKEFYTVYRSIQSLFLTSQAVNEHCTVVTKPLAPFFTTGMSSPVLDRWAMELQQFDTIFGHIQGKLNLLADAISKLRTLGMYKKNDNVDEPSTIDDVVENLIQEINSADSTPKKPTYNVGQLNLEIQKREKQQDRFCKGKVKDLKIKPDPNFLLNHNCILRKVIKLKYTIEPAIVQRKLTSIIIIEFHNAK